MPIVNRRAFLSFALSTSVLAACSKKADSGRCRRCGMKLDPTSPWRADLVAEDGTTTSFDTPRCALNAWRSGQVPAKSIRVQEYYERVTREGSEVRFVVGGDVIGPMGPDFVPVEPGRVTKFIQDHSADRAVKVDEIDKAFLDKN